MHSSRQAPTVRGRRACASGLCWEEHTGPHMAQGGIQSKGPSGVQGQHQKEAQYNQGLGRACRHVARGKGDSGQPHRLGPQSPHGTWPGYQVLTTPVRPRQERLRLKGVRKPRSSRLPLGPWSEVAKEGERMFCVEQIPTQLCWPPCPFAGRQPVITSSA